MSEDSGDDGDRAVVAGDDGGLASMVTALSGEEGTGAEGHGQPLMHRVELAWRQMPVVPTTGEVAMQAAEAGEAGEAAGGRSLFASHETAELLGCGEDGEAGGCLPTHVESPLPPLLVWGLLKTSTDVESPLLLPRVCARGY